MKTFVRFLEDRPLCELAILFAHHDIDVELFCEQAMADIRRKLTEISWPGLKTGFGALGGMVKQGWNDANTAMAPAMAHLGQGHQNQVQLQRLNQNLKLLTSLRQNLTTMGIDDATITQALDTLQGHFNTMKTQQQDNWSQYMGANSWGNQPQAQQPAPAPKTQP